MVKLTYLSPTIGTLILCGIPLGASPPPKEATSPGPNTRHDHYGDPLPEGAVARLGTLRWQTLGYPTILRFSSDGKYIALGESQAVHMLDTSNGRIAWKWRRAGEVYDDIGFSPDGKTLAAVCQDLSSLPNLEAFQTFKLRLWENGTFREKAEVTFKVEQEQSGGICLPKLSFSPDSTLVVVTHSRKVCVYSARQGDLVAEVAVTSGRLSCCFSPDSKSLAVLGGDEFIRIHNPKNGRLLAKLQARGSAVLACGFSADGSKLLAGSVDGTFRTSRPVPSW